MIRVILVDDEELSLQSLEKKLLEFPEIEVIKKYNTVQTIIEDIIEEDIDVAFLDIEMPMINGIHLADKMLVLKPNLQN